MFLAAAVRQFINLCNEASWKKTEDKVTSTFDHLSTPNEQVSPALQCVDFYKGDTSYAPDDLYTNFTKKEVKGETTKLQDFFKNDQNYTALIGGAGTGKTTLAKRFARSVLDKKIEHLKDIELVRFVTLSEFVSERECNAFDSIFNTTDCLTKEMETYGMQWVKDHSNEILLVLDGLDETSWTLNDQTATLSFEEPSHSSNIIQNIMKKHLLPQCKILLTSREHAIEKFPIDIRPQKIIALTGLSNEDRDYLIVGLAGEEKRQRILEHLKQKSPGLLSLCKTPGFNGVTVTMLSEDLKIAPITVLLKVLGCFLKSENRREKDIHWIFSKLKELAYKVTAQKPLLFKREDITSLGRSVNEVNDLALTKPCESPLELSNLMAGYYRLFFCHQHIQEALAALFICAHPLEQFKQFVQDHLDNPHFSVMRKVIFGVILNPKMNIPVNQEVIGAIPGKEEKIAILQDWLRNVLHHRNKKTRRDNSTQPWNIIKSKDLELYSILNECGVGATDVIKHDLQNVKYTLGQLGAESLYTLCTVLSQCEKLEKLELGEVVPCDSDVCLLENCLLRAEEAKIECMRLGEGMERARFVQLFRNTLDRSGDPQGDDEVPEEVFEAGKKRSLKVSRVKLDLTDCEKDYRLLLTFASFFPGIGCIDVSFEHDQLKFFQDSCKVQGGSKLPCDMKNISLEDLKNLLSSVITKQVSIEGQTTGSETDITANSKQQSSMEEKTVEAFKHSGNLKDADDPSCSKWKQDKKLKDLIISDPDLPQGAGVNTHAASPIGAQLYIRETRSVRLERSLTRPTTIHFSDKEKFENACLGLTQSTEAGKVIVTELACQQNVVSAESTIHMKGYVYTSSLDNYVIVGFSDATLKNDLIQTFNGIHANRQLELNSFAVREGDEISVTINLYHDDKLKEMISISPNIIHFSIDEDFLEGERKFVNEFFLKSSHPIEEESIPLLCTVKKNGHLVKQNGRRQFALEWQEDPQNLCKSIEEPGSLENLGEIIKTYKTDMNKDCSLYL